MSQAAHSLFAKPPFHSSECFHVDCTICGEHLEDQPQLSCLYCRSRTHVGCAQVAMGTTELYTNELGAERLAAVAVSCGEPPQAQASLASSSPSAALPSPLPATTAGVGGSRVGTSPHHRHKASSEDVFFCSADCALSVGIYENPNFSPAISAIVEEDLLRQWRSVTGNPEMCREQLIHERSTAVSAGGKWDGDVSAAEAVYLQLRFDAWCRYFTLERATFASPPMLPPSHLSLAEEVVEYISDLVSAAGQAERLYLCDAAVGSLLALPHDGVWRGARPIQIGETNNFLAESTASVVSKAVEPHTTVVHLFKKMATTKKAKTPS